MELSFKNKRVRIYAWIMIPSFICTILLFIFLPRDLNRIIIVSPLLIGYFIYMVWKVRDVSKQFSGNDSRQIK
ncbi:hypothetical protein ACFOZ1_10805 [Gracilibacillus marinus]|jgi:uncharacterized membrane protein YfcA|uniref:Uncharacterized protein n=1 Tax=Gracilibacillus marinus TaxID=630535 RepID=A0ABV8VWD2_9BACI